MHRVVFLTTDYTMRDRAFSWDLKIENGTFQDVDFKSQLQLGIGIALEGVITPATNKAKRNRKMKKSPSAPVKEELEDIDDPYLLDSKLNNFDSWKDLIMSKALKRERAMSCMSTDSVKFDFPFLPLEPTSPVVLFPSVKETVVPVPYHPPLPPPAFCDADGNIRIGAYTKEERKAIIERFRAKKRRRVWRKQIKYDCRKRLADTRPRVKGRFVSRKEDSTDADGANFETNTEVI